MFVFLLFAAFAGVATYSFRQINKEGASWGLPVAIACGAIAGVLFFIFLLSKPFFAFTVLSIAVIVVMFKAQAKTKSVGARWGPPVAGGCAAFLIILFLSRLFFAGDGPSDNSKLRKKWAAQDKSAMAHIGQFISEQYRARDVLVVVRPDLAGDKGFKTMVAGLKKGLGRRGSLIRTDELEGPPQWVITEPGDQTASQPPSYTLNADVLDYFYGQAPDTEVIVSFAGFPRDYKKMEWWSIEPRPHIILIFPKMDKSLEKLVAQGDIGGVILWNPTKATSTHKNIKGVSVGDPKECFDSRYLLVTKETLGTIANEYPHLFSPK